MKRARIVVDAMGGDHAPDVVIDGALAAARNYGIDVTLVGIESVIRQKLKRSGAIPAGVRVTHAPAVIDMDESPTAALRQKRESSVAVGMQLVKSGEAAAFVSAGNSGAVMAVATLSLGRLNGVERPALGTVFPSAKGRFLLLDVGANADVKPNYLVQFAQLGRTYAERVMHIERPRIGLLNIGEEPGKGNELSREVFERLTKQEGLNFVGNIEGKDLTRGAADVVVTDGFTGNVALKTAEGVADFILRELRLAVTAKLQFRIAALVLRPALMAVRRRIDYAEYGGANLLGLNGIVLICHGRSDAHAISSAVRAAFRAAQGAEVATGTTTQPGSARASGKGEAS